ncbi:hypothetical protein BpHYR1_003144 [Brachionus plicatilis]|uniref:Uncharacterized protein n=1 Tax=Brachionus plicatilis TaxID=10195 RepID=A0A3M7QBH8_BRAPC|nr:hypothetical protein BpHYR1_003144 [Brachionus plicatilis]
MQDLFNTILDQSYCVLEIIPLSIASQIWIFFCIFYTQNYKEKKVANWINFDKNRSLVLTLEIL